MSGSNGSARISLNMTDRDVAERAAVIMGGKLNKPRVRPAPYKTVYSTELFSNKAAGWMMTLYPLMGERRQKKIEETLATWKAQRSKNPNGMGRKNPRSKSEGRV